MTGSSNEINLDGASPSQVLRASQPHPSLLSSAQAEPRQHLFVSGQINAPSAVKIMVESVLSP